MARRAQFGDPAVASIHVRVTEEQRRTLERHARENRISVSSMIRDAVNSFVADYQDGNLPFRSTESK